jgi:hypothetical protein
MEPPDPTMEATILSGNLEIGIGDEGRSIQIPLIQLMETIP